MKILRSQGVNGELRTYGEMEGSYGVARIALAARETLEVLGSASKRVCWPRFFERQDQQPNYFHLSSPLQTLSEQPSAKSPRNGATRRSDAEVVKSRPGAFVASMLHAGAYHALPFIS
jgi:hypothetical protein